MRTLTPDRRRLLDDPAIDVLYLAVPHHLHEQLYLDAIAAGKDFLGEKPFGIDLAAARRIVAALRERPDVFVRCSSEMPYFPGAQLAFEQIRSGALGQMIEARHAFLHSSDLDRGKPINWKRQARYCGEIGVMGDLGMHVVHLPLRLGWRPRSVYAVLQDIVTERPGPDGAPVPCDTWDNATLHVDAGGFPLTLETKRIAPGRDEHVAAARARDGRRRRLLDREPEGRPPLRACATAARSGSGWRPAASPRSRPSPGRSSSSASPTRSCRCGPRSWPSARARSATGSAASRRRRRWPATSCGTRLSARPRPGAAEPVG